MRNKVNEVIAEAFGSIETKICQLLNLIESDTKISWKFELENININAFLEASIVQDGREIANGNRI